jgi:hypothetical protein
MKEASRTETSPRRRLALGGVLVVLATLGALSLVLRTPFEAGAGTPRHRSRDPIADRVEVTQDGTILALAPDNEVLARFHFPPPYPPVPASTLLFRPYRDRTDQWILAWSTETESGPAPCLFAWGADGRERFRIPATLDTPFNYFVMNARKFFIRVEGVETGDPNSQELAILEIAHYNTSCLRIFSFAEGPQDSPEPREILRFYHPGHMGYLKVTSAPDRDGALLWLTGSVNSGPIYSATTGDQRTAFHLICLPLPSPGVYVFPPWTEPGSEFLAEHPEGFSLTDNMYYFVTRGHTCVENGISWVATRVPFLDSVNCARTEGEFRAEVLIMQGIFAEFEWKPDGALTTTWGPTSDLERALRKRADRAGESFSRVSSEFFADSLVYLVWAPPGTSVRGNLRDVRDRLPRRPS